MNQANQLEIAGSGESYGVGVRADHAAAVHARGAVEDGSIGRSSWTPHQARRAYLSRFQKGHSMDLVDIRRPGDAITRVNPDFVWKKSQGLMSQGFTLGSHSSVPLGPCYLWKDQESKHEHPTEDPRRPNRVESIHFFSL